MSLTQDFNSLFAPMDKKYCDLFYGISIYYFVLMVIVIIGMVFMIKDLKRNKYTIFHSLIAISILGINYIYNRLLFNMCHK